MPRHLPLAGPRGSLRGDGTRVTLHPQEVHGRFNTVRLGVFGLLLGVYALVPWVRIGGRPAVLLDVASRRFFLFGSVFNPQDLWLSFFLLSGVGFGLVALTTLAGRVWCGYACPQTVFLEGIFRPLQRVIEGNAHLRARRERGAWSAPRALRRALLWLVYAMASTALAHVVLGYFTPVRELWAMILEGPSQHPEAFGWTSAVAAATFLNFAWFREQTCVAICPYGRLQSALSDGDTLVIGYDESRGEPRARGRVKPAGAGDCVDCDRCVAVCPTGIDIRDGLQLDCIACARCIDACDDVMGRLGRARGLIRYDSQKGLSNLPRRFWRPRIFLYAALGAMGLLASGAAVHTHTTYEANLLRLNGMPYTLDGTEVRNAYDIHLVNKLNHSVTFHIEPVTIGNFRTVIPLRELRLCPLGGGHVPVFVSVDRAMLRGDTVVRVRVRPDGVSEGEARVIEAPFLGPSP